ncbi:YmaF family protein [Intestinibacter sp.]
MTWERNNCRNNSEYQYELGEDYRDNYWYQYESGEDYRDSSWYQYEARNCYNDERQRHVHEYTSNVKLAERCDDRHTHHISGVTGEAILIDNGRNHVHQITNDNTETFEDHHHRICDTTGPAIPIRGTDKHIHLLCGRTSRNDGHSHEYEFVTLIESPTK